MPRSAPTGLAVNDVTAAPSASLSTSAVSPVGVVGNGG